jgi:hypothetical protein
MSTRSALRLACATILAGVFVAACGSSNGTTTGGGDDSGTVFEGGNGSDSGGGPDSTTDAPGGPDTTTAGDDAADATTDAGGPDTTAGDGAAEGTTDAGGPDTTAGDGAADATGDGGMVGSESGTEGGGDANPGDSGPTCTTGAKRCVANAVQTCSNGQWGTALPCTNETCVSGTGTGTCTGMCAPGQTHCMNNGVQMCTGGGAWGAAAACTHQTCVSGTGTGTCTGVCAPMDVQCMGNQPQNCDANGNWQNNGTACTTSCVAGACTAGVGPDCRAADGGIYTCSAGQHCCVNTSTQASSCAASCAPPLYAVDCAGASGTNQCGAQTCCGTLVISGGTLPNCTASELTSACTSGTCNDNPPGGLGACNPASHIIKLCTAVADCAGDANGNTMCCRFSTSPLYWCVGSAFGSSACM